MERPPFARGRILRQKLILGTLCLGALSLMIGQPLRADEASTPVVTVILPTIDEADREIKALFDLANDKKGYEEFKDTLEAFLIGVDRDKPSVIYLYATPDGAEPLAVIPIKNGEQFRKFTENLFDLDVKTFPPPMPGLMTQVPREKQAAGREAKLQSNERLIFGLYDAYMKFDQGHVRIGEHLQNLRSISAADEPTRPKDAKLYVKIDGERVPAEARQAAFAKTRDRILKDLKAEKNEADVDFQLRKAFTEQQLYGLGQLFAQTVTSELAWQTDLEKKVSHVHGTLSPAKGSALAETIGSVGKTASEFAGVPTNDCVFVLNLNLSADAEQQKLLQNVVERGRAVVKNRIEKHAHKGESSPAADNDLADLVFDIIDGGFRQSQLTSFVRTWEAGEGKLTTVGGARVEDGSRFVELLQKIAGRRHSTVDFKIESIAGTDIHRVKVHEDAQKFPEFLDADGAVYVGTSDHGVWYGIGPNSLKRLKEAIDVAHREPGKAGVAVELEAKMLPLVKMWNQIATRRRGEASSEKPAETDSKGQKAVQKFRDLELDSVAMKAFQKGKDTLSAKATVDGNNLAWEAQFDEGMLRFVGESLSKFVKDNLAD